MIFAGEQIGYLGAKPRYRRRKLVGAAGCLAQPEWNRWRLSMSIGYPDSPILHSEDFPRSIPELKDVTLQALNCPVFINRADYGVCRLKHHRVISGVGDRPARCNRG